MSGVSQLGTRWSCDGVTLHGAWRWPQLRSLLQQHVRELGNEAASASGRENSLLFDAFEAGQWLWQRTFAQGAIWWPGSGQPACYRLQCAQCPIGEALMRGLVLLTLPRDTLQRILTQLVVSLDKGNSIYSAIAGAVKTGNHVSTMVSITIACFWELMSEANVHLENIIDSGWPLFEVLNILTRIARVGTDEMPMQDMVVANMRTVIMRRMHPQSLKDEMMASHVDLLSVLHWYNYSLASLHGDCHVDSLIAELFLVDALNEGAATRLKRACLMFMNTSAILDHVEKGVRLCVARKHFLALPSIIFKVLDYLQMPSSVRIVIAPSPLAAKQDWRAKLSHAVIFVPRAARPKSYGRVVGNNIRATQRPHCSWIFQNVIDIVFRESPPGSSLQISDVGGMLGDCCLWALRRAAVVDSAESYQRSLRCIVIEPNPLYAELTGRTAEVNNLRHVLRVRRVYASSFGSRSLTQLMTQDRVNITSCPEIVIIKIHTAEGSEISILNGSFALFKSLQVNAAVVTPSVQQLAAAPTKAKDGILDLVQQWLRQSELSRSYVALLVHPTVVLVRLASLGTHDAWQQIGPKLLMENLSCAPPKDETYR